MRALALAAALLAGCGASALERHATAATVVREALATTASTIEEACPRLAHEAAVDPTVSTGQARRDRDQVLSSCGAAAASYELAVGAWTAWVDALLRWAAGGPVPAEADLAAIARRLAGAYDEIRAALGILGVILPPLGGGAN